jgi:excisionase family DNA binding protein
MMKTLNVQDYPNLLTVPEAAEELRISRWTIYKLIQTKELKTLTIASRRFVASDDLASFIKERKEVGYET